MEKPMQNKAVTDPLERGASFPNLADGSATNITLHSDLLKTTRFHHDADSRSQLHIADDNLDVMDVVAEEKEALSNAHIANISFMPFYVFSDKYELRLGNAISSAPFGSAHNVEIYGGDGNDILNGGIGNDTIFGGTGDDTIYGKGGNDTLIGGLGNDTLWGDVGNDIYIYSRGDGDDSIVDASTTPKEVDTLKFIDLNISDLTFTRQINGWAWDMYITVKSTGHQISVAWQFQGDYISGLEKIQFADGTVWNRDQMALASWFVGTSGSDKMSGDYYDNMMIGGAGDDTISGKGGNDTLIGGLGNDTLWGDVGNDTYIYSRGDGDDSIVDASTTPKEVDTLKFIDLNISDLTFTRQINGWAWDMYITVKSTGHQISVAWQFQGDYISGLEKIQFADGTVWNRDQMALASWFVGTNGADTLNGDSYDNTMFGGAGADTLYGGAGNDFLNGGLGADYIDGGNGTDTADYSEKTKSVVATLNGANISIVKIGGVSEDTILNIENLIGGTANDVLTGDSRANSLKGGAGDDLLKGAGGIDFLDGGVGIDTADYGDKTTAVSVTLNGSTVSSVFVGGVAEDTIVNIENLIGGSGNDILTGDSLANSLNGGAGNDILAGGAGNDRLAGGLGNDILTGDSGQDVFIFAKNMGVDSVTDFNVIDDTFGFDAQSFGIAAGSLMSDYLVLNSLSSTIPVAPNAAHGYFLVDKTDIYWDQDGSGAAAAVKIASFGAISGLTAADFMFI